MTDFILPKDMPAEHRPIERDRMFEPMLEADPSFAPRWNAFLAYWADQREPPLYGALNDLAGHLIEQARCNNTAAFPAVFDVVEAWCVRGDAYVREAAVMGLLEGLQNRILNDTEDGLATPTLLDFEAWLKPASRQGWDGLNAFGAGAT